MITRLFAVFAVCLVNSFTMAGEGKPADKVEPTRTLKGTEYGDACAARDRADQVCVDLQKRMPAFPRKRPGERAPAVEAAEFAIEIGEVVQAYQDVIKRYPHTEIASTCAMHLAAFYQYQGKYDEGAELLEKTATEFAGTREGARVALNTGLIHAQGRKDHVRASHWFARVTKPEVLAKNDQDSILYLSAQQQLIKCELALDRDKDAEKRLDELKQSFPIFVDEIDRFYKFEVLSRDGRPRNEQKKEK